jgi:hypothetical protein
MKQIQSRARCMQPPCGPTARYRCVVWSRKLILAVVCPARKPVPAAVCRTKSCFTEVIAKAPTGLHRHCTGSCTKCWQSQLHQKLLRQLQQKLLRQLHPSGWFTPAIKRLVYSSTHTAGSPQHTYGWFTPATKPGRLSPANKPLALVSTPTAALRQHPGRWFCPALKRLVHPSTQAPKRLVHPSNQTAGSHQHQANPMTPAVNPVRSPDQPSSLFSFNLPLRGFGQTAGVAPNIS